MGRQWFPVEFLLSIQGNYLLLTGNLAKQPTVRFLKFLLRIGGKSLCNMSLYLPPALLSMGLKQAAQSRDLCKTCVVWLELMTHKQSNDCRTCELAEMRLQHNRFLGLKSWPIGPRWSQEDRSLPRKALLGLVNSWQNMHLELSLFLW